MRRICLSVCEPKKGGKMSGKENILKRIRSVCPGAEISKTDYSDLTVLLLKDRDFPDGDDVCIGSLHCVAKIPVLNDPEEDRGSVVVIAEDGSAYLVRILSEAGGCIYTRSQIKLEI
ncbi:MAG: hypothetical protein IKX06_03430 [Clostridia bacterium]|nr:hypothetical protein [Clostridia bacterium]